MDKTFAKKIYYIYNKASIIFYMIARHSKLSTWETGSITKSMNYKIKDITLQKSITLPSYSEIQKTIQAYFIKTLIYIYLYVLIICQIIHFDNQYDGWYNSFGQYQMHP